MKLFIKYMVSRRCKIVVRELLEKVGAHHYHVGLGEVDLKEQLSAEQYKQFNTALHQAGLELIADHKTILVEKIKHAIIEWVHGSGKRINLNLSDYLSLTLQYNYTYLANQFAVRQGSTIEQFFIAHKIERVKELLVYDELTLTEIAAQMHYSSVGHLSAQFKKVTGHTPSHFKQNRKRSRRLLENV